jgi:hypothetical protein
MDESLLAQGGGDYGTAEWTRIQSKRKGSLSTKCLLVSSAIVVVILVGALHFYAEEPASSAASKPSRAKMHAVAAAHASKQKQGGAPAHPVEEKPKVVPNGNKGGGSALHSHMPAAASGGASMMPAHELAQLPKDMRDALNASVDPCDNFYEFSCGGWDAATAIPDWQSSWAKQWDGVTTDVEKKAVKALEQDKGPAGQFYQSCMDVATVQKLGAAPLKPWLAKVELVQDHASLVQGLADFALADMTAFFGWWVDADSEDSTLNSFFVAQGGITMPDRSYYLDQGASMHRHRQAFSTMVVNILQLSGRSKAEAAADAANVLEIETALAKAMKPDDEERDEHGVRISVAGMRALMPTVDWNKFLKLIGTPEVGTRAGGFLVVKNQAYLRAVDALLKSTPFAKIRSYLRWQAVYSFAPYLSYLFEDELVTYNKDLYGISVLPPITL